MSNYAEYYTAVIKIPYYALKVKALCHLIVDLIPQKHLMCEGDASPVVVVLSNVQILNKNSASDVGLFTVKNFDIRGGDISSATKKIV